MYLLLHSCYLLSDDVRVEATARAVSKSIPVDVAMRGSLPLRMEPMAYTLSKVWPFFVAFRPTVFTPYDWYGCLS